MAKLHREMVICQVCKEQKKMSEVLTAELVRGPTVEKFMETHPDWSSQGLICIAGSYRSSHRKSRNGRNIILKSLAASNAQRLPHHKMRLE